MYPNFPSPFCSKSNNFLENKACWLRQSKWGYVWELPHFLVPTPLFVIYEDVKAYELMGKSMSELTLKINQMRKD